MKNKIFLGLSILFVGILVSLSIIPSSLAAPLTNEIVEPSNNLFGLESHYVIGFTTATTGTIKVITVTFPAGFNILNVKLILASGIGSGGISIAGPTLTYTVNSAVSVPLGRNIIIDFGKIVNNAIASNTVSVTTRDTLNNIIDGPTTSPAFTLTSVSSTMLGSNAVTNAKIANGAVTNTKIAKNVINGTQIIDGSITDADISPAAAILLTKLAVGLLPPGITINSANIVDGSITRADIASNSGIVVGAQSCSVGQVVTGFNSTGNIMCQSINNKTNTVSFVTKSINVTKPSDLLTWDVDVTVPCDTGSFVTGGGTNIFVAHGNSGSDIKYFGPSGNGYRVAILNTDTTHATVYAICATNSAGNGALTDVIRFEGGPNGVFNAPTFFNNGITDGSFSGEYSIVGVNGTITKFHYNLYPSNTAGSQVVATLYLNGQPTAFSCSVTSGPPPPASCEFNGALTVKSSDLIAVLDQLSIPLPDPLPATKTAFVVIEH